MINCDRCEQEHPNESEYFCEKCINYLEDKFGGEVKEKELIKELLDFIWDIFSDGDETTEEQQDKYLYLAKKYNSYFGEY
jgi:hypothetical protein